MIKGGLFEIGTIIESVLFEADEALSKFLEFWKEKKCERDEDFKKYSRILSWLRRHLKKNSTLLEDESLKAITKKLSESISKFSKLLEKTAKSSFGLFNSKSSFIEEARKHISELCEYQMDIAATIEKIEEEEQQVEKKFKNLEAAKIWIEYFTTESQVSKENFMKGFARYNNEKKLGLSSKDIEKVANKVDHNRDLLINCEEWEEFFERQWSSKEERERFLKFNYKALSESIKPLGTVTLTYINQNQNTKKPNLYKVGEQFQLTENGFKIISKGIEKEQDLKEKAVIFGRTKDKMEPDVKFNIASISSKQFQICAKRREGFEGFYLNNLSKNSSTSLKVENVPIILEANMIFNLNLNYIKILSVSPTPKFVKISDPNYIYLDFEGKCKLYEDNEEYETTTNIEKKVSKKNMIASLEIAWSDDIHFDKFKKKSFEASKIDQNFQVSFGSGEKCDVQIEDISPKQLIFEWNSTMQTWISQIPKMKGLMASYLLLLHAQESKGDSQKSKISLKLRSGITIECNENEFKVDFDNF